MFAPVTLIVLSMAALPHGTHIVEGAHTEQLLVHRGEAIFVVDANAAGAAGDRERVEVRAVRLDSGASRIVLRGADSVGRMALDKNTDTLLVAVRGMSNDGKSRDGVVFVPLTATAPKESRVFIDDVRDLLVCAGRRYATSFVFDQKVFTLHDLTSVPAGAKLETSPPLSSSPLSLVAAMKLHWPRLSCASDTLAVTTDDALYLLDPSPRSATPRFVRVPVAQANPDESLREVLPLPGGDILTWNNRRHLRVLDRAGTTKAVRSVDAATIALFDSPTGARVIAGNVSFALPYLDDPVAFDAPHGTSVALDARRLLTLVDSGLRESSIAPVVNAADVRVLHEPTALARRRDGRRFAVGQKDGVIVVFDRSAPMAASPGRADEAKARLTPVARIDAHSEGVLALAFLTAQEAGTAGDVLVSVGDDDIIHVFEDRETGGRPLRSLFSVVVPERTSGASVAFDTGRGLVAVGGYETRVEPQPPRVVDERDLGAVG